MSFHTRTFLTALLLIFVISMIVLVFRLQMVNRTAIAHPQNQTWTTLTGERTTINIEVVDTPASRERGLSGRLSLPEGQGMLFVFDSDATYSFWMPNMRFAIDIIWIDSEGRIVDIKEHATPESYPEAFKPKNPARYVLEVGSGYAQKWGWHEGTTLKFRITK